MTGFFRNFRELDSSEARRSRSFHRNGLSRVQFFREMEPHSKISGTNVPQSGHRFSHNSLIITSSPSGTSKPKII